MRLPTRNFISTVSLVAAVGLVLVASVGGISALFSGAVLCLLIAAGVGFLRVDRRAPDEGETQAFVASVLGRRGYAGSFRIEGFSQVTSPGIGPGNVRVKFRGRLVFLEALYQPAAPAAQLFEGFTPRKIEWLGRAAATLEHELGSAAAGIAGRAPPDPFRATFVGMRRPPGWALPFTGSAWAVLQPDGWSWDLAQLSQSVDALVVQGRPLGAHPAAVALEAPEGRAWLASCLGAWRDYETEIGALQHRLDQLRAERAREAMGGFFRDVQAGATYQGTGESLTHQVPAARYFLEFLTANAATGTVAFTLRSDRRWNAARAFTGTVTSEPGSSRVTIRARTQPADAQPEAGPLLSVSAGFELELQWYPGEVARIEGSAVDLVLRLSSVRAEELARLLEEVQAREREIATAIEPGRAYRGAVSVAGRERPLRVEFVPPVDPTAGAARLESGDWSGMFRVRGAGDVLEPGFDLVLESTVRREPARGPVDAGTPETWGRVLLALRSGRLSGVVESGATRLPVAQLIPAGPAGAQADPAGAA